ncbi:MAG: hypothetical protein QXN08_04595, partial [Nitrososphaerales archaeon]
MQGAENPLASLLSSDSRIASKLNRKVVEDLLGSSGYGELVGDAPERCLEFVQREINPILERYSDRVGIRADSEF